MGLYELLEKTSPVKEKRQASKTDLGKLVDANTKLVRQLKEKEDLIKEVIQYIKEHCVDDEFYTNLSNKEKGIIDALTMLENGSDNNEYR